MPEIEKQISFYDNFWKPHPLKEWADRFLATDSRCRRRAILSSIQRAGFRHNPPHEVRILDLGCGNGVLTSFLSHYGKTTGVDLSENTIIMNRKKYPHIEFRSGNIFEVELESNFYDLVVASELIEHLERENHPNFFRLLHRTLSPEGRFILSTPNKDQMKFPGTQPIENWLTYEELRDLLSPHFQFLSIETARFFFNNLFLDRTWLLLSFPFNPYLIEPWVKKTLRGKYFIVTGKKKS